jgi:predicted membrane protein (TIGR00267 family)
MPQTEEDALPGLPEGYHEHEREDRGIGRQLRDIILGGQDGLVNVLGLVLGVAAATAHAQVIIVAGLAATFAESIAMAGVAYTSALADRDYYRAQLEREKREIDEVPEIEKAEVREIFREKGLKGELLERVVQEITSDRQVWLDVMMRDELHLTPVVERGMAWRSFVTGISTFIGSLIPLVPFFFLPVVPAAFVAVPLAAVVLFGVGFYKAKTLVGNPYISGLEMLIIGMLSALAGYLIGRILHVSGT